MTLKLLRSIWEHVARFIWYNFQFSCGISGVIIIRAVWLSFIMISKQANLYHPAGKQSSSVAKMKLCCFKRGIISSSTKILSSELSWL